jgi:hypothetical protein
MAAPFIFEIDIRKLLPVLVAHDKTRGHEDAISEYRLHDGEWFLPLKLSLFRTARTARGSTVSSLSVVVTA